MVQEPEPKNPLFRQAHYQVIEEVLAVEYEVALAEPRITATEAIESITVCLADRFTIDNRRFRRSRWYARVLRARV